MKKAELSRKHSQNISKRIIKSFLPTIFNRKPVVVFTTCRQRNPSDAINKHIPGSGMPTSFFIRTFHTPREKCRKFAKQQRFQEKELDFFKYIEYNSKAVNCDRQNCARSSAG
jgi:hypothetical protein